MSLFGNWPLLCFHCCCCCWNSLSLKSLWLWLTFLWPEDIVKDSITTETDEYSSAHTGKKWIGDSSSTTSWEASSHDSGSWVDVPKQDDPFPLPLVHAAAHRILVHWPVSLIWKVTFLPTTFHVSVGFQKGRMASLCYLEKKKKKKKLLS